MLWGAIFHTLPKISHTLLEQTICGIGGSSNQTNIFSVLEEGSSITIKNISQIWFHKECKTEVASYNIHFVCVYIYKTMSVIELSIAPKYDEPLVIASGSVKLQKSRATYVKNI